MALVVSIVGWSGKGKTTFIRKVIEALKTESRSVAAVKIAHSKTQVDGHGKDTFLYAEAGADAVCLASETETVFLYTKKCPITKEILDRFFPDVDIVLGEGLSLAGIPRFEVTGGSSTWDEVKYGTERLDGIVSDNPRMVELAGERGILVFSPHDVLPFVRHMEGMRWHET